MIRLPIVVMVFIFILYILLLFIKSVLMDVRSGRKQKAFIKVILIIAFIVGTNLWNNLFLASRLPNFMGRNYDKKYIMNLDEIKSSTNGTRVKLVKAFMDLNHISFNLGVKGKDKLVAVEIKKNLEDEKPIKDMQGLWGGERWNYQYNGFGIPYDVEEFISTAYLVCYLSSGEELIFKIEDLNNVKEKTAYIKLNETIEHEGRKLTITGITKGLNYTTISAKSDTRFWDMEMSILVDGKEVGKSTGGWSGAGGSFDYNFSFKPIEVGEITLKISMKNADKEYLVKVKG